MLKSVRYAFIFTLVFSFSFTSNLFFSEYAEGSSNNKYLEIYNASGADVDLSGYSLSSCSNGCDTMGEWEYPDNVTFTATLLADDVYVVCHGSADDAIKAECDQTFTYLSNGDDVFALTEVGTGLVLDVVGMAGDDPGSGWDVAGISNATKDHTLVRKSSVTSGNPLWLDNPDTGAQGSAGDDADDSEWIVLDQNTWDYLGSHTMTVTTDECTGTYDACGVCDGDGSSCQTADITFGNFDAAAGTAEVLYDFGSPVAGFQFDVVGLTVTGASGGAAGDAGMTVSLGGNTVLGFSFTNTELAAGTGVLTVLSFSDITADTAELTLGWDGAFSSAAGVIYTSTGDTLTHPADCAGTYYGTAAEDCAGVCGGTAVLDVCDVCNGDGSACALVNLFFSEHSEGSSNNKYFEIYNPSSSDVNLSYYQFVTCSNGCTDWEYMNDFADGAMVAAGGTYTVCHSSFDGDLTLCDETRTVYHNGDDAQGLMHTPSSSLLDLFGDVGDDPGSGWEVAGVANATKDHTLVRKSTVTSGNTDWSASAGTDSYDSEWVVLPQNTWEYMGSHPHTFTFDCAGVANGTAVEDCAGVCGGDAVVGGCDMVCGSTAVEDCAGVCGGSSVVDVFGHCDGGNSLQNAIDLATEGSTINLPAGTYTGPFTIDKSVTLQGEDQTTVFVENADINSNVFSVCLSSQDCDVTFDNLTIRTGLYGIRSKSTGVVNVTNSTFYHNGYDGETLPDPTADTGQADYAALWASSHTSNGGAMRIEKASGGQIAYNTVYNNLRGIRFQDGTGGMIHDNVSHDNFESGIYLAAGSLGGCVNTSVYDNTVYNNMNNGLLSIGGLGNSFSNNNVYGNWNAGMQMWFASDITVSDNTFTGNNHKSFNGIGNNGDARGGVTYEGAGAYPGSTFGCKVLNNTISDNGRVGQTTGVYVRDDVSSSSEITGNTFSGQDPDITYGTDTVASGNTCSSGCDCNTGSVADQCGVCDGDDSSCADCAGTPNGDALVDDCGVCGGDGTSCVTTVNFAVDMSASMYPNADYDNVVVNGDWPGSGPWYGWGVTLTDDDADGVYTGSLTLDPATSFEFVVAVTGAGDGWSGWGVQFGQPGCDGSNFTATTGDGGTSTDLSLSVDDLVVDCAGTCGGDAVVGGCDMVCGSTAVEDCAGVCGGDSVIGGCDNLCGSTLANDDCGVCGGDGTSCLTADITFGTFDAAAGTAEVLYDFGSPVAGFQFDVLGLTVTGASGGAAGDAGMTVSLGGETVLGFSFTNTEIAAGTGVLTVLSFTDITADTAELTLGWNGAFTSSTGVIYASTGDTLTHPADCAGTYYGSLAEDVCGVCDGPGLNADGCCGDLTTDCAGNCGGTAVLDACGVCGGFVPDSYVCDGNSAYGNGWWGPDCADGSDEGEFCCNAGYSAYGDCADLYDCAGVFMGDSVVDCAGVCGGSAMLDACGVCDGGNTCEEYGCPEGTVADCSGDGGCSPAYYLGDGWCDGVDQPYGYDLTCYAEESTTDCAVAPAVGASCGDGSSLYDCMLQCVPAGLVYSYDGDGWCDDGAYGLYLNCPEFDNDSGDCGAATGGTDDSCVYSNDGWCDEPMWCATGTDCTDCGTCTGARAQAELTDQQASERKAEVYAAIQEVMDRYKSQDTRTSGEEICLSFAGPDVACDGVCFSDVLVDECGECGGDNSSCADCAGTPNGTAEIDYCGVCDGDGTSCLTASLTFGAFDSAGSVEVLYDTGAPVAGFQFDVTGLTLTGASGGAAAEAGMTVSLGGATVIGFSLTNTEIPAGSGLLTVLSFSAVTADISELGTGWSGALTNAQGTTLSVTGDTLAHTADCAGTYYGDAVVDDCGVCDGDGTSCVSTINFAVDMNGSMYPNADYDNVVLNGDWPGSGPWFGWGLPLADEDGDGVFTGSLTLDPNVSFEFVVAVTGPADGYSGWGVQFGQPGCDGSNFTATTGDGGTSSDLGLYVDDLALDECGVCGGDNSTCLDCAGVPNGGLELDECGVCGAAGVGDANGDGFIDVSDIVYIIDFAIAGTQPEDVCPSDINDDGVANIIDIVGIVNIILGTLSMDDGPSEAIIEIVSNELSVRGIGGTIDGVQLTLSHDADFSIDLVDVNGIEFAVQNSIDENTTIVLIAKKDLTHIGTTTGDYTIVDYVVVGTDKGEAVELETSTVVEIAEFKLGKAYPNPFNPTTNLELAIPEAGYVSVKVYNLVGQEVATLVDGMMDANPSYTFQWNAGSLSSGVYLVRAEGAGQISTQKLMLLK